MTNSLSGFLSVTILPIGDDDMQTLNVRFDSGILFHLLVCLVETQTT